MSERRLSDCDLRHGSQVETGIAYVLRLLERSRIQATFQDGKPMKLGDKKLLSFVEGFGRKLYRKRKA